MGIEGDEGVWNTGSYERGFTIPICEFTDDVQRFKDELAAIGGTDIREGNIDTNDGRLRNGARERMADTM